MSDTGQITWAVTTTDGRLLFEQADGSYRPAPSGQTDWARVDAMSEAELERAIADDPDDPANDPSFWQRAEVAHPAAARQRVTLRLDREILAFFKAGGRGYQDRIRAALRSYVEEHRRG
jgi:uncharacterized protein (DUF4415 family)